MSTTIKQLQNKKWMHKQYHGCNRSMQDIAEELGTNRQRVRRALIRLGVEIKDKSTAQKDALKSGRAPHPTEGTERPEEVRLRISESVAEDWATADEATLQARSDKAKQQWANMPQHERDALLKLAREAVRRAAKDGSQMEKSLRLGLTKAGYDVKYHTGGLIPGSKLEVDMLIPELSIAIEVDGPSHFLPIWGDEKLQKNIKADIQKNGLLLHQGLVVIRVKQLANSVSQIAQRRLLAAVLETIQKVEKKFPRKNKRLIEIEV